MKERPKMPYVHGEPEGLGRRENEEVLEEERRLAGEAGYEGAVDEVDTLFNDLGRERGEEFGDEPRERLKDIEASFSLLPVNVQREILQDMQQKMKRNYFKTIHDMLDDLERAVGQNEKMFKTGPDDVHVLTQEESRRRRMKK